MTKVQNNDIAFNARRTGASAPAARSDQVAAAEPGDDLPPAWRAPPSDASSVDDVAAPTVELQKRLNGRRRPPARWASALALLAAALLGPVVLGGGVLYVYGIAKDAPLSAVVRSAQSPLEIIAGAVATLIIGVPQTSPQKVNQGVLCPQPCTRSGF